MCHERAVTSSELACCPLPAQVFSQQLPNQHAIFFSEFKKYEMISKSTFHGGIYYLIKIIRFFFKFQSNKNYLKYFENILFS
jgi:hypothetical protein